LFQFLSGIRSSPTSYYAQPPRTGVPLFQFLSGIRSSPTGEQQTEGHLAHEMFQFLSGIRSSPTVGLVWLVGCASTRFNSFQELEVLQPLQGVKPIVTYTGFNSFQELEVLQRERGIRTIVALTGFQFLSGIRSSPTKMARADGCGRPQRFNSFQELEVLQPWRSCLSARPTYTLFQFLSGIRSSPTKGGKHVEQVPSQVSIPFRN